MKKVARMVMLDMYACFHPISICLFIIVGILYGSFEISQSWQPSGKLFLFYACGGIKPGFDSYQLSVWLIGGLSIIVPMGRWLESEFRMRKNAMHRYGSLANWYQVKMISCAVVAFGAATIQFLTSFIILSLQNHSGMEITDIPVVMGMQINNILRYYRINILMVCFTMTPTPLSRTASIISVSSEVMIYVASILTYRWFPTPLCIMDSDWSLPTTLLVSLGVCIIYVITAYIRTNKYYSTEGLHDKEEYS